MYSLGLPTYQVFQVNKKKKDGTYPSFNPHINGIPHALMDE